MTKKTKVNAMAFCTVFIWASAFPLTKIAMGHFAPISLGFLRCALGATALLLIGRRYHMRRPQKRDLPWFLLAGATGFSLYLITFNTGIQTLTSATSSIIVALTPIITAVAAWRIYGETIKASGWIAIFCAFGGVLILLLWEGVFSVNIGLLWTLGAPIVFSIYNIVTKKLASQGYSALEITAYSMLCGTILLIFWVPEGLTALKTADFVEIMTVIYLGLMPSALSYLLWGSALTLADRTGEATNYMFVTPLLSAIMGFFLLKEIPNLGTYIGGFIIIGSIIFFNKKGLPSPRQP